VNPGESPTFAKNDGVTRIGLLSDTHHYFDEAMAQHLSSCDEIWHGGDFGTIAIARQLENIKPLRGVYGNIDGPDIRDLYPEELVFTCEAVKVYMKHIGGYPGKYAPGVKDSIKKNTAQLFISGHSHILKIMHDDTLQCLHINPGAAGRQGWHKVRTLVRFSIDGKDIRDCEIVEL
jgi:uncharacterized protein